jgi:hypothetical protein
MNYKVSHDGAQMPPIEAKRSDLSFAAGTLFGSCHDLVLDILPEPVGLYRYYGRNE